jgi:4-hydroxy-tetrahydrodipicolinate synthase
MHPTSVFRGPIATVPTAFDQDYELDLGRMAELTKWWVANGLVAGRSVIKVAAAMGEGPDLADDEWPFLLRTVVQAADGKVPVVCGLKTKDTKNTVRDARRAQDLGAVGLQIDLPIFHHPTQDDYVRYFTAISDAIDIGIMIYNTWWFGAEPITPETMLRLADAEHVEAIKWSVPPGGPIDYDAMTTFAHRFNVIDNSSQPARCIRNGGAGYINTTIHAYPPHELAVWDLLQAGRYDEAQQLFDRVNVPLREFMAKSARRSGGYRVQKALMEVMGHPMGPMRPPTLSLDPQELAELRALVQSFGWPVASA